MKRRKKWTLSGVISALMGFACAVLLAALFYGAMVYQLADGSAPSEMAGTSGGILSLTDGTLTAETTQEQQVGGVMCSVIVREYRLPSGAAARAITASPAAYLERLAEPGVVMEMITGFVIDDRDAVYARSGDTLLLAAREGETVYMIESAVDQNTLYALGASARVHDR